MSARPFHVCIHDTTPAYSRATHTMLHELAPIVGRRLSCGVVPDWHSRWPLVAHPGFCGRLRDSAEELLLHGYHHRRQRGFGPISLLTDRSDEMNGLDDDAVRRTIDRGQEMFTHAFGAPARGFVAPAWQRGRVDVNDRVGLSLDFVLGFFSLESRDGRTIPLATCAWDWGRWTWPGHFGHAIGRTLQTSQRRLPVVALHPKDLERGFWPQILRVIANLRECGYRPSTLAALMEAGDGHVTY